MDVDYIILSKCGHDIISTHRRRLLSLPVGAVSVAHLQFGPERSVGFRNQVPTRWSQEHSHGQRTLKLKVTTLLLRKWHDLFSNSEHFKTLRFCCNLLLQIYL